MRGKQIIFIILCFLIFFTQYNLMTQASDSDSNKTIVYFYSSTCDECNNTKKYLIKELKDAGIEVIEYEVYSNTDLHKSYAHAYKVEASVPLIFAGEKAYYGYDDIKDHLEEIKVESSNPLKEVEIIDTKVNGFLGFLAIITSGLIDGVNPCAIAMLLMFISLLGFTTNKSTMIKISASYILGLFLMYFALGTFLYSVVGFFDIGRFKTIINIFVISFSLFLFFFNMYDFVVAKNKQYGQIKNQLPKPIQKMNKKIIKFFTENLNNKNMFVVYLLTFTLGVIISMTEFLCTGQIYLPTILGIIQNSDTTMMGVLLLLLYNIMFVLPLIIIAFVAIRSQSVMKTSNFIREHLHIIKLITALLFLGMALFFLIPMLM